MAPAIVVVLSMAAAGAADAADAAKGSGYAARCAPCHGATGVSVFDEVPNLAGQQQDYLVAAMKAFRRSTDKRARTGVRKSRSEAVMSHQMPGMTDADIENLAAYFAQQQCASPGAPGGAAPPKLAERCIACHGEEGRSRIATVPSLAGQPRRYLENEIRDFRDAKDQSNAPRTRFDPIMAHQSLFMTESDITTIAAYFAGRPCR